MNDEFFDGLLLPEGPVALTIREPLQPVLSEGGPVFPPTFAPPEGERDKAPSYVINELPSGKVALIDTVGAQANRIEPLFLRAEYRDLVPQIEIRIGERKVHLLEAGHRAADAVVRFSDAADRFHEAFAAYQQSGEATALAKLAPTSIVFGVWDSRDTQVKLPRLVESTIRAWNVEPLTRSAQFFSALEKDELNRLSADQNFLSEEGLDDAPAGRGVAGVIARDGIRRDATLNLIALRALSGGEPGATRALQRYILGLALIAFRAPAELYLRQGCLLVADQIRSGQPRLNPSGARAGAKISRQAWRMRTVSLERQRRNSALGLDSKPDSTRKGQEIQRREGYEEDQEGEKGGGFVVVVN